MVGDKFQPLNVEQMYLKCFTLHLLVIMTFPVLSKESNCLDCVSAKNLLLRLYFSGKPPIER